MKKLLSLWRMKDESLSRSSDLSLSLGSTYSDLSIDESYNFQHKHSKKLHKAVSVGDLEKLKEYLKYKKHDVDKRDKGHRTPLHLACANGYESIVSLLIEKQCKINVLDGEKRSPLIKAIQYQKEKCVTILLDHGADPNLDGYTPLLLAVVKNNAKMVKFLLKKGADVNASDNNQRTPLMIALSFEPTNLVSLLLQQGVDLSCQDIYGFTAAEYASCNGFTVYYELIDNFGKLDKVDQTSYFENTMLGNI
ncbi:ankyrin repeat domain-containing protein 7 isoform X2 [Dipodomys merriami]|uniref:ankyrin repeat domain-containing protein 7 isoform X2 n=1 Tax=Dipodomys merriami TaxID=94247 RepID=UPI003855DD70